MCKQVTDAKNRSIPKTVNETPEHFEALTALSHSEQKFKMIGHAQGDSCQKSITA